jgi:hypothetical protein
VIVPRSALQVTEMFEVFDSDALKAIVWPLTSAVAMGLTVNVGEPTRFIVMNATAVGSALLLAATVTVSDAETAGGAVYNPDALIEPTPDGLSDQVTPVSDVFATAAVS